MGRIFTSIYRKAVSCKLVRASLFARGLRPSCGTLTMAEKRSAFGLAPEKLLLIRKSDGWWKCSTFGSAASCFAYSVAFLSKPASFLGWRRRPSCRSCARVARFARSRTPAYMRALISSGNAALWALASLRTLRAASPSDHRFSSFDLAFHECP